jgi:FkbM family methyltransferase
MHEAQQAQKGRNTKALARRLLGKCYELSLSAEPPLRRLLSASGWVSLACLGLRKLLLRAADPIVLVHTPHGITAMPFSHELPRYYFRFPLYDSVVTRLSTFIRATEGHVSLVDIGANIADTALCAKLSQDDRALLVEPTRRFHECASANMRNTNASFELMDCLVGATEGRQRVETNAKHGTARLLFTSAGVDIEVQTIDKILADRPDFKPNFIKVDTDGHDLKCLMGAKRTIKDFQPSILFEADVFDCPDYATDFFDCCTYFLQSGYERISFYSNTGDFMWTGRLSDVKSIAHLLFYHATSGALYYDILLTPPHSLFHEHEIDFFTSRPTQQSKRLVSHALRRLIS